jgi:hypothetical protein
MTTRSKAGIFKPKVLTVSSLIREPTTVKEALLTEGWKSAMRDEFLALQRNQTWVLVSGNSRFNVVGNKWVL